MAIVANSRSSIALGLALLGWAAFGSWALFRPNPDVPGLEPAIGHVVVFFFVSLALFGLFLRPMGRFRGFLLGGGLLAAIAVISELLQPILTETRRAQQGDFLANGFGIAAAMVVSGLLAALLRKPERRELATAVLCVAGLVASGLVISTGADRIRSLFDCRGRGLDRIAAVSGEPIIHVDRQVITVADQQALPMTDGVVAPNSADLRCSVLRSGSYSIVATVVPESIESNGPTRIFTSSGGIQATEYNTHIGQDFDELSIRVRSGTSQQWESVPDVFVAGQRVTVAVTVAEGQAMVFVDGERRATFDLVGESFADWDETYPILIGDEFTRDRTFEGDIELVSFFDRALDGDDEVLTGTTVGG